MGKTHAIIDHGSDIGMGPIICTWLGRPNDLDGTGNYECELNNDGVSPTNQDDWVRCIDTE